MFDRLNAMLDDKPKVEASQKQQKEFKKIGSQPKVAGHILYSYNTYTGEIKAAEFQVCDSIDFWTLKPIDPTRVIVEKDCIYRQALNKKNVIKHLKREGYSMFR